MRSEGQVGNGSPVCNPVCELRNSWYGAPPLRHLSPFYSRPLASFALEREGEKQSRLTSNQWVTPTSIGSRQIMETGIGSKIDLDGLPYGLIRGEYRGIVGQMVLKLAIITLIAPSAVPTWPIIVCFFSHVELKKFSVRPISVL